MKSAGLTGDGLRFTRTGRDGRGQSQRKQCAQYRNAETRDRDETRDFTFSTRELDTTLGPASGHLGRLWTRHKMPKVHLM